MNKDKVREIVMEILIETEPPKSGRDLFWYALKGVFSTWIYMLGSAPLASIWWVDGVWHYSIPICSENGYEEFRQDAMHCVEAYLADSKSAYIKALS